jgi:hypothetical protein
VCLFQPDILEEHYSSPNIGHIFPITIGIETYLVFENPSNRII